MDYLSTICNRLRKGKRRQKGKHGFEFEWVPRACTQQTERIECATFQRLASWMCVRSVLGAWEWCYVKHGTDILRFSGTTASTFFCAPRVSAAAERANGCVCTDFSFFVCSLPSGRSSHCFSQDSSFLFSRPIFLAISFCSKCVRCALKSTSFERTRETTTFALVAPSWCLLGSGCMCSYLDFIFSFPFPLLQFFSSSSSPFACVWLNRVNTSWTNGPSGGVVWNET